MSDEVSRQIRRWERARAACARAVHNATRLSAAPAAEVPSTLGSWLSRFSEDSGATWS